MSHDPRTQALEDRVRLERYLRLSDLAGSTALAAVLRRCSESNPCGSATCSVCGLVFQRAAVAVVDNFIRESARAIRNRMTALTIVPSNGCLAPDDLTVEACERVADEVLAAFEAAGLSASIAGLEVSFNEDMTGEVEPHWCVHVHAIVLDWLSDAQEKALRAAFPPSRLVRRPVYCEFLDQDPRGRRYPFKPERVRRVTDLVTGHPGRRPYRTTKSRPLRPWQAVSLAIVDHQLGFHGRLLIHGIDEEAVWQHLEGLGWPRDGP